jgi:hypothetical protein
MKWFDKEEIKNQELLNEEQIAYLREPSLTILGPLNFLIRKHWDYLVIMIITMVAGALLDVDEDPGLLTVAFVFMNAFFMCALTYFFVKHGRRLAWNRNKWNDFETFEKSEKKWLPWACAGISLIILQLFAEFSKDFWEGIGGLLVMFSIVLPFIVAWSKGSKPQLAPVKVENSSVISPPNE